VRGNAFQLHEADIHGRKGVEMILGDIALCMFLLGIAERGVWITTLMKL